MGVGVAAEEPGAEDTSYYFMTASPCMKFSQINNIASVSDQKEEKLRYKNKGKSVLLQCIKDFLNEITKSSKEVISI